MHCYFAILLIDRFFNHNILQWPVLVIPFSISDLFNNILPFNHLPENAVPAVKPGRREPWL